MACEFPRRILAEGGETPIDKINNTCKRSILDILKVALDDEYKEVLKDPVFGPLLAINENRLIYSGKVIHSFICKQLRVSKLHELWFIFARRPLRFSIQEFHAVTGLKCKEEAEPVFDSAKLDKGFWSKVLRQKLKVNILSIRKVHLGVCNKWSFVDRVRLVYLCVIHGFLIAKSEKVHIPHAYIRLVMDFEKMRNYPWGLRAYDELVASILRARDDLHLKNSYVLDGFSYAFQIWLMEAIPDIGTMVGRKLRANITKVRCRNWMGSGKVSYEDIRSLELNFNQGVVFPFISATGNADVVMSDAFVRVDEKKDERVDGILSLIKEKQDWSQFTWEVEAPPTLLDLSDQEEAAETEAVEEQDVPETQVEEPSTVKSKGKRLANDPGSESRKKQLLCQRAAENSGGLSPEVKSFIEGLFTTLTDTMKKDIQERFDKLENEVGQRIESGRKGASASEIPGPSASIGKVGVVEQCEATKTPAPSGLKGKAKAKAAQSVDTSTLRSTRSARKVTKK